MDLIESYKEIDEENRLQSTLSRRVEYLTTINTLDKYCFSGMKCLDVGCGVGIYSLYLKEHNLDVTSIDLVPKHINRLNEIIKQKNINIKTMVCNALNLSTFKDNSFDIVLCMGPLYHLLNNSDQNQCIKECIRVVKPNGIIMFSYISPFSVFPCAIRGDINRISNELVDKIIDNHCIEANSPYCFWTDNYFHDPSEIEKILINNKLEIIDHLATDGQSIAFQNTINQMTDAEFDIWMRYHLKICRNKSILGTSNHGLIVTRKKV